VSRAGVAFKQRDLAAALKAIAADGIEVRSVEIDPVTGKIVIMTLAGAPKEPATDLDKWLVQHGVP
jgi:hypothetical protein